MNDPIEIADPRRKAASFRHRIDQSIGAPPVGIGQAGRSRWYAVARGYDKLKGSSRVYLEAYIADWCDMHDLEVALGEAGRAGPRGASGVQGGAGAAQVLR